MFSFQRIQPFIPVEIGNHDQKATGTGNEQEFYVLIVAGATAAHGEQGGPEQAPDRRNAQEMPRLHVAHAHYVAQIVFRKTGDKKQEERNEEAAVFQKVIVLFNNRGLHRLFHKGQTKESGQCEGDPGSDSKADGGINGAEAGAVNVPADKSGDFTWYRGCYDLQDLKANEDEFIIRMKGFNERDHPSLTREVYIQVVVDKEIGGENYEYEED